TNVTDWASRKTCIVYDLAGHVTSITRPNGTVRSMGYDDAGELTNIVEKTAGNSAIAFFKLKFDSAARVQWGIAAPLPPTYTPPSRTMAFDDDDRLAAVNTSSVTCDSDGNLTSGPLTNSIFKTYVYNARNQLVQTLDSAQATNSFAYDALGNRVAVTNGTN